MYRIVGPLEPLLKKLVKGISHALSLVLKGTKAHAPVIVLCRLLGGEKKKSLVLVFGI